MPQIIDIKGQRFSRLTVIEYVGRNKDRHSLWLCKCDCGNTKILQANTLKQGLVKSCGCFNSEKTIERNTKHGGSGTRLYRIWKNMRQRCLNPNQPRYKDYGGRGITVCNEWNSYENFKNWSLENGYSDQLSIDRIDNNGIYEPYNCRWATTLEQAHNKSREAINRGKIKREVTF